jgi:hypothetical protein
VVIALASRSISPRGLRIDGQVSQWAFGSQGFESLPRRHEIVGTLFLGYVGLALLECTFQIFANEFTKRFCLVDRHYFSQACTVIRAFIFLFFSGIGTILSCMLFKKV